MYVSVGAKPLTPSIKTSPEFSFKVNDVKSTQTSGEIYFSGLPSSYKTCSETVSDDISPELFSGLHILKSPLEEISTIG